MEKSNKVKDYFSLVKFSHTIFAMPFAFIGYFLATRDLPFNLWLFIKVILCMVLARNAAMGFNRYIDRQFDRQNPRTSGREIPSGKIKADTALIFVVINCILFCVTTFYINMLVFYLSPIALITILGYSYTKRFTILCHLILGAGISLAPIGAYLAVSGHFALLPVLFSAIVLFWIGGFDIIYALQDIEFDRSMKLKSIPSFFGAKNALLISIVFHSISILLVVLVGYLGNLEIIYWIGAAFFTFFLVYQHIIVKPNDFSKVNLAFATSNGIASFVYATFFIIDLYF